MGIRQFSKGEVAVNNRGRSAKDAACKIDVNTGRLRGRKDRMIRRRATRRYMLDYVQQAVSRICKHLEIST